ncbi:uncharacterized protein JCM6883_000193 [Sporobolomyces salmoneus]|uniref:uncharacterized protein n=1 Tax=Sporobolomyces salmoneus TaxID=183962 RepID=UPI00317F4F57
MFMAQTKTMPFLAYVHRASNTALSPYLTILPEIAIRVMKDCPSEAVAMKKDLFIAIRHILQSELRMPFLSEIDTLLDEFVLTGNSITGHEHLRPLAYSTVADLIHHCRADLTLSQLSRVVHTYCANIHDPTLVSAIHTMCSKSHGRREEVRDDWSKFSKPRESLGVTVEKVKKSEEERIEWEKRRKEKGKGKAVEGEEEDKMDVEDSEEKKKDAGENDKMEADEGAADKSKEKVEEDKEPSLLELDDVDTERAKPLRKVVVMVDPGPDPVKDARFLFRNLLFGFKTLSMALTRMGGQGPDAELMCRFFDAAVKCTIVFDSSRDRGREQTEVMEVLSSTPVGTELVIFQEVLEWVSSSMNSSGTTSYSSFPNRYSRTNNNRENTSVMLRLYKMSFMAVTIFPEKNEPVLLPHLTNLIMNSLKFAQQAAEPNSYYLLLRALFRSIGGGRFEILYNEVLPSLQVLLEQLNALLKSADKSRKDLFAELILTVPVRLSVFLPYLSYLMRPLVHALHAGTDLISQGLRTLELCVDNLTQQGIEKGSIHRNSNENLQRGKLFSTSSLMARCCDSDRSSSTLSRSPFERVFLPWLQHDVQTDSPRSLHRHLQKLGSYERAQIRRSPSPRQPDPSRFGWVSIRFDDITASQSAYLLIASFLSQFDSPTKIILQIYLALLRAHQTEARKIVCEALDILAPALPKRIQSTATGGGGGAMTSPVNEPIWAKWTRKVLVDDGSQVALLINVYQLIVRHPDLFFSTRELFIPHMVASLGKLTLNTAITADTRQEQSKMDTEGTGEGTESTVATSSPKREKATTTKSDRAGSISPSTTSSGPSSSCIPSANLRDQVINNLLRFISNTTEPLQRNNLVYRAVALLRELIGHNIWGESNVKLWFFQRTFANDVTEELLSQLCNSAEVLNVVSSYKPADWHLSNIAILHSIVEKGFLSGGPRLAGALRPVIEQLFEHLPKSTPVTDTSNLSPPAKAFVDWARTTVDEGLRSMNNLASIMLILQSWGKVDPEQIDAFIPSLIRVFSRLTKDHAASPTVVASTDPQLRLLVSSIEILHQRVSNDTIAKAFEIYKGEVPSWYWITFVPQLLLALSGQQEARYFRVILVETAKAHAQAVFYHLRTTRDEFTIARRQLMYQQRAAAAANGDTNSNPNELPPGVQDRYPVEYIQEILNIQKTAFPLLALSLEMVTDQFVNRFRPPPEEDIYRLVTNLLNDALQLVDKTNAKLAGMFTAAFERYSSECSPEVVAAGPKV